VVGAAKEDTQTGREPSLLRGRPSNGLKGDSLVSSLPRGCETQDKFAGRLPS